MVNVKYTVIELNLYFVVQCIVLKFENIWLTHTLNIIQKPKKSQFSKRKRPIAQERYIWITPLIELNLYLMFHGIVLKF
jgi:hypothetical protein